MNPFKRYFKRNSHSWLIKPLAGLGRSLNRFYENRNHDSLSNGELTILQKLSKLKPTIIFDIGANVGDYSKMSIENCDVAKVYAFEPVSATFQLLTKFQEGRIVCIKKGISSEAKKILINIYPGNPHSSLHKLVGVDYEIVNQEQIEVITGDQFIQENNIAHIDLVKMDIEGGEMDALIGFTNALKDRKIRLVQFEYGYINITTKILLRDYYDFFTQFGYMVGKIYPKSVDFRDYSINHEDFIGPNFAAIHKDDLELRKLLA